MSDPVTYLIVGAGDRGQTYARFAKECPDRAQVVAVAEPRKHQREKIRDAHGLSEDGVFTDWREVVEQPKMADAVVIATQDADHAAPAIAFAKLGYHILLEKPMAPSADDCRLIVDAVQQSGVMFAVGHVLRYTTYFRKLKELIDSGAVGDVITVQHAEPVGFYHMAHSFVRGNWRNQEESTFMLLAKSCHDLDMLRWLMDEPCARVSSFGSLQFFKRENQPEGASDRCLDCAVENECAYSAKRLYNGFLERGQFGWPLHIVTDDHTEEGLEQALREGPYGRCVFACDNDVVDHQVVNMEFASGRTANFVMTAFSNPRADRTTRIFGSEGELIGDGRMIECHTYLDDKKEEIDTREIASATEGLKGHGGGDGGIIAALTEAIHQKDPSLILSGPEDSLDSHLMVFAAEESRRTGATISL